MVRELFKIPSYKKKLGCGSFQGEQQIEVPENDPTNGRLVVTLDSVEDA